MYEYQVLNKSEYQDKSQKKSDKICSEDFEKIQTENMNLQSQIAKMTKQYKLSKQEINEL